MSTLPWQSTQWTSLIQRYRDNNLPHAILLTGVEGIGKQEFARQLSQGLLCQQPADNGEACGECKSCLLLNAGTHPDLLEIVPEEAGKAIKVDQVRQVTEFSSLSSFSNGYKVIVICPAESMNKASANSLLKTLEEPSAQTILLLVSSSPQQLLPTVRSRCQQVFFPAPSSTQATTWLQDEIPGCDAAMLLEMAGSAPLKASQFSQTDASASQYSDQLGNIVALIDGSQNPLSVANSWQKSDVGSVLGWFSGWVMDIIRLKASEQPPHLASPAMRPDLQALAKQLECQSLHHFLERLYEARRLATTTQVNTLLLLEEILIRWAALPKNKV